MTSQFGDSFGFKQQPKPSKKKMKKRASLRHFCRLRRDVGNAALRPAGSDPDVVCQKYSFLKVSVSLGGFGISVAHGKLSVRGRCVQATENKEETCSLLS